MKMHHLIFFVFPAMILTACNGGSQDVASLLAGGRWFDLTWDFDENTVYWPTNETFKHDTVSYGINASGYFYSSFRYSAEEHGGTHFMHPFTLPRGAGQLNR